MQRAFAPLSALLTGLLFAGGFLVGSAIVRVISRRGRGALMAMTGTGRYAFWGIVAFLVIVIAWLMLQMT